MEQIEPLFRHTTKPWTPATPQPANKDGTITSVQWLTWNTPLEGKPRACCWSDPPCCWSVPTRRAGQGGLVSLPSQVSLPAPSVQ